jgi:hypothetical protein
MKRSLMQPYECLSGDAIAGNGALFAKAARVVVDAILTKHAQAKADVHDPKGAHKKAQNK